MIEKEQMYSSWEDLATCVVLRRLSPTACLEVLAPLTLQLKEEELEPGHSEYQRVFEGGKEDGPIA